MYSADDVDITFVAALPGTEVLTQARELGDSQTQTLGLLPYAAWDEYAAQGRILCALETGTSTSDRGPAPHLLGYTAFRTPRGTIALTHLAVSPAARRRGVARQLVNELRRRYPNSRGISARCRRDYAATDVWPRMGFVAQGDRRGRSIDGHLLTDWWLDFGQPDLLTWQGGTETTTPIVIDTNIFLALHGEDGNQIAQVMAAVADRVQILVTPELSNELNRNTNDRERQRLIRIAQGYPQLPVSAASVDEKVAILVERLGHRPSSTQDQSDARQVAYAIAAGIELVVTQDRNAKSRLGSAARDLGVTITNPYELVVRLDEREDQPSYSPQALKSTGYSLTEAGSDNSDLRDFINTAHGERRSDFETVCNQLAAHRPQSHRLLLRDPLGQPIGLIGTTSTADALTVSLLRIRTCALQSSVAAQLVGHLRTLASSSAAEAIIVEDDALDSSLYEALREDGYHPYPGGLIAITIRAALISEELRERWPQVVSSLPAHQRRALDSMSAIVRQAHTALIAYQLEHQLRPLRLLDSDIGTWILSIKPAFATDLFGYPPQLFVRQSDLGIQREHVYFRGGKSGETYPGRVLWYATDPHKEIFAVSSLVEVRDLPPHVAHRRYRRLGVYDLRLLRDTAKTTGTVRALRVTDTEILDRPIPLARLREMEDKTGRTLQLVSANKIDATWFRGLMGEAFNRG